MSKHPVVRAVELPFKAVDHLIHGKKRHQAAAAVQARARGKAARDRVVRQQAQASSYSQRFFGDCPTGCAHARARARAEARARAFLTHSHCRHAPPSQLVEGPPHVPLLHRGARRVGPGRRVALTRGSAAAAAGAAAIPAVATLPAGHAVHPDVRDHERRPWPHVRRVGRRGRPPRGYGEKLPRTAIADRRHVVAPPSAPLLAARFVRKTRPSIGVLLFQLRDRAAQGLHPPLRNDGVGHARIGRRQGKHNPARATRLQSRRDLSNIPGHKLGLSIGLHHYRSSHAACSSAGRGTIRATRWSS